MTLTREIAERLAVVRARVTAAATRVGRRPEEVTLIGVAKRKSTDHVVAAVRAGLRDVAENYIQEAASKIPATTSELERRGEAPPRWHFIGQLQRNKARDAVRLFDRIESVDREPLGAELDRRAEQEGRKLELLLQVNLSEEPQKGGAPLEALPALLAASRAWPRVRVVGLMTIPAASEDPEAGRSSFARLRALLAELRGSGGGEHLSELSMGMSGDFEVAIEEGATIVRVGTAIFGPRSDA